MINRLKQLRKDILNISQKEFGEKIGLTLSTISALERNKSNLTDRNINLICKAFNINENWIRYGKEPIFIKNDNSVFEQLKTEYNLNNDRLEIIKNYLSFTKEEQQTFISYIKRLFNEPKIEYNDSKIIKIYDIPVSAGLGSILTDDTPYEMKNIDLQTSPHARRANFALYVRGDSMEPIYYDGDIIFVKEQNTIESGQIGVFIYDNESYIKKYVIENDNAYLVSLNDKYKPIKLNPELCIKICGIVL